MSSSRPWRRRAAAAALCAAMAVIAAPVIAVALYAPVRERDPLPAVS